MIQRILKIKNFRNIGNNEYQKLELNALNSPEDKFGGLVTLIGMNNAGKSNYLSALEALAKKRIAETDKPHFNYNNDAETVIAMWIKENDPKTKRNVEYQYKLHNNNVVVEMYDNNKLVTFDENLHNINEVELSNEVKAFLQNMMQNNTFFNDYVRQYASNTGINVQEARNHINVTYNDVVNAIRSLLSKKMTKTEGANLLSFMSDNQFAPFFCSYYGQHLQQAIIDLVEHLDLFANKERSHPAHVEVSEKYGIKLLPKVLRYTENNPISETDMISDVSVESISNPGFFKLLFSLLKKHNFDELTNAYVKFYQSQMKAKAVLSNYMNSVNMELDQLSEVFNRVYGLNVERKYKFHVTFESSRIYFMISEDGVDVQYDAQSTGFKWFFNFFFKVFASSTLKNGDIVILDEPATNLHVSGQVELRNQIKKFGIEQGITFVISTHSPFLIDTDYLDEVRIVSKQAHYSVVDNKFSVKDDRLTDVLMPIQSSLTVNRHILFDPNKTLIFVEGITDYNYLTAFKNHFGFNQLTFLPVQGIKNTERVFKELIKINSRPIILVDADYFGSKAKSSANRDKHLGIEVRLINEIDDKIKAIEDFFTEEERQLLIPTKSFDCSTAFKNHFERYKDHISDLTKNKFKRLLESLMV